MKTLTVATIKGGAGKTTTALALAQAATAKGVKVLIIDLDPQANMTLSAGADRRKPGSFQALTEEIDTRDAIQTTPQGLDIMAGSADLATLTTDRGSAGRLARALDPIKKAYKLAIIDTPPTMGEMIYNALTASNGLLCPLEADPHSIQGFYHITDIASHIKAATGGKMIYTGAVITRYDGRANIAQFMRQQIQDAAIQAGARYEGEIRRGVSIIEAQALQKSLYEYAPKSKPAADYLRVFENVSKIMKL